MLQVDNGSLSKIRVIRLINGTEIMGKMTQNVMDVTVERPSMLVFQPDARGTLQIGMGDLIPFAKEKKITISNANILFIWDPEDDIANEYRRMFGQLLVATNPLVSPTR